MNRFVIAVTAALCMTGVAQAQVTEQDLLNDQTDTSQVVTNGMGRSLQRYSPLKTLNKDNVKNLVPAWAFSFGGEKQRGQETQPLVYDGVMYVTGSYSRVYAIDLKTGKEIWEYDARLPEGILPCCDVVNRGAAIYGDKLFFGTLDARIVALDLKTGKTVWKKKIANYKEGYSYTAAPLIVHGLVITGNSGGEFGIIGEVQARDAETGDLVWTRPTIEGNMGTYKGKPSTMTGTKNATWPGDMWKTGGGATWLGGSYDADTDTIVFGAGNPAPWNSWLRNAGAPTDGNTGDNLYAASRIGLDPATGEIKWHYQTTPREGWDYDGVNEVVAFTDKDGNKRFGTADRNGFFYVLNRADGKFVTAHPFVHDITWAKGIGKDGRPIYNEADRPGDPTKAADGEKGENVFAVPSFLGGKNWMPVSYSQNTGLFYVPSNEWGMDIWNEPINYKKGAAYLGAGFTIKPIFEDHIGSLKAIDPMTGEVKWEYKNDAPLWGGVMTTAGGLVFTGTPEGYFKAFDDDHRQGAVELPDRFGHRRPADHLGEGRRAICLGRLGLGRRGPAVGRRGGQEGQLPQPGRHGLDVQAAQTTCNGELTAHPGHPRPVHRMRRASPSGGARSHSTLAKWRCGRGPARLADIVGWNFMDRPKQAFSDIRLDSALIVDDHPLFCDALSITLKAVVGIERIETSGRLEAALARLERGPRPDVIVLDLNLPDVNGFDGLTRLRTAAGDAPIVVVSSLSDNRVINSALRAGADGFVPKHSPREVFRAAFAAIRAGGLYLPEGFTPLGDDQGPASAREEAVSRLSQLTRQQARILQLICEGKLNKQIAYDLSIAETTVKAHVTAIMRKLGVQSRTQAVLIAQQASFANHLPEA